MKAGIWFFFVPILLYGNIEWKTEKDGVSIEFSIHPSKVALDGTLSIQAAVRHPVNYEIDMAALVQPFADPLFPLQPRLAISQLVSSTDKEENGYQRHTIAIEAEPLEKGALQFSFFKVTFKPLKAENKPIEIFTPVFEVFVQNPSEFDSQYLPIGPILPLEPQFPLSLNEANRQALYKNADQLIEESKRNERILTERTFPWLSTALVLCLSLSGWIIYAYWQVYRQKLSLARSSLSPKQKAFQALEALSENRLPEQGSFKAFYAGLTAIALTYLEERLHLSLQHCTTVELRSRLRSSLPAQLVESLIDLFERADLIKFANQQLPRVKWQEDALLVQTIIQSHFEVSDQKAD